MNLAQRLEALDKQHGTTALVLEATAQATGSKAAFREIATTRLRGEDAPVNVLTFAETPEL